MTKPGIIIKREYNDYEAAFNTLRERANIYKDLETFDKNEVLQEAIFSTKDLIHVG